MKDQSGAFTSINRNDLDEKSVHSVHLEKSPANQFHIFANRKDTEIWSDFQAKHEGAFSYIYNCYFDSLFQYGCQFTQDRGFLEDMLQEFFLELRLKRHKLGKVENIRAYLLKSFRRRVFRQLAKRNRFLLSSDMQEGKFDISFQQDMQFINSQFAKEQQKRITQLLKNLTSREREVIYHFYFENLDYKSIAQVMELSGAKTVRNLLYKALSGLKKKKHLIPEWLRMILILWV